MTALSESPRDLLDPIESVVSEMLVAAPTLCADEIMVVGAQCRDIHHQSLGHEFATTATSDLDLGVALRDWSAFEAIAGAFPRVGRTGIRFQIAGVAVDVMPFGAVENPAGVSTPTSRGAQMSVWAFGAVHGVALSLRLSHALVVTIPTVAGYAALKLCAWLDRREAKDAGDIALILHWYCTSAAIRQVLYDHGAGEEVLIAEQFDLDAGSARQLGRDISATLEPELVTELRGRWDGRADPVLVRELRVIARHWPGDRARREELLDALTRGLFDVLDSTARPLSP